MAERPGRSVPGSPRAREGHRCVAGAGSGHLRGGQAAVAVPPGRSGAAHPNPARTGEE